jgi:membrane associated rhomboid family serine protease
MIPLRDLNPTRTTPFVTLFIIAANVAIFIYQVMLPQGPEQQFVLHYGMVPDRLSLELGSTGAPLLGMAPVLTSMFLHGGFMHILGNMWFLWVFGDNIEDRLGHFRFVWFYLLCGVGAALAHFLTDPRSTIPVIGASGAISGVLGAYLVLFPGQRVITLIPLIVIMTTVRLPAVIILGYWFVLQFVNGLGALAGPQGPGVAWWAHIGGFVLGMVLVKAFEPRQQVFHG